MPGAVLYMRYPMSFSQQPQEVGVIITLIEQMRELRV